LASLTALLQLNSVALARRVLYNARMKEDNRMQVTTDTGMLIIGELVFHDVALIGLGGAVFVVTMATTFGWLKG
jgi:hypothetical protein